MAGIETRMTTRPIERKASTRLMSVRSSPRTSPAISQIVHTATTIIAPAAATNSMVVVTIMCLPAMTAPSAERTPADPLSCGLPK